MSLLTPLLTTCPVQRSQSKMVGTIYEWKPASGLPPSSRLYTAAGREVVNSNSGFCC
ncbi:unnamed protein product, partial [Staurois parvus]